MMIERQIAFGLVIESKRALAVKRYQAMPLLDDFLVICFIRLRRHLTANPTSGLFSRVTFNGCCGQSRNTRWSS